MPVDDRLGIEVSHDGGMVVIALHGELDLASAPVFSDQLHHATAGDAAAIVVDLSELDFMDSTGLRSILEAHQRCGDSGRRFAVVPGTRQVARLLEVARVEEHLDIVSSPDDLAG